MCSDSLPQRRFTMSPRPGSGTLALLLAASAIYVVLSCTVVQRTNEIGIRMALGARRTDVGRIVLQQSLGMAGAAVAAGWIAALIGGRLLRSLLFEVSPNDLATLLAVSGALLLVAVVSALIPVWRAV